MIPFLVTLHMLMSFPVYISSFWNVRLYFRTEIEANVLGSWTMNVFYHRNIRLWKDCRVYDHEKVKFYRLVACFWTIKWTVKGPSTFEQNSNNKNKQL